jgi:3-hydroxyisobutyrate dehydrogenase
MTVGFIGLGTMGRPMALNLARAGTDLIVWNRTPGRAGSLREAGSAAEVFAEAEMVILMLASAAAINEVLDGVQVRDRTVVHMGTTSPADSVSLGRRIGRDGGTYVEAPVSGSRRPAENAELVAMLAGDPAATAAVEKVIAPMCRATFTCGPVPQALTMKLAVNIFLITTVTGLAETFAFAGRTGLDLELLRSILDAGQMASGISRVKTAKLAARDFEIQAGIADVLKNNDLVLDAAHAAGAPVPLIEVCRRLYAETLALGHGGEDMAAVVKALEAR